MRKKILFLALLFLLPLAATAQMEDVRPDEQPGEEFFVAEVMLVLSDEIDDSGGNQIRSQVLMVKFLDGSEKGREMELENSGIFTVNGGNGVAQGDKIVIYKIASAEGGEPNYYLADVYRLPSLYWIIGIFLAAAVLFARWKGVTSILGLGVTIATISFFVVPQIIKGGNPLLISLAGALIIAFVSIYVSHGFNRRTTIALVSTLITLGVGAALAWAFVAGGKLFGLGSEEAFYLQFGPLGALNLRGLLLGGIILGALGVLDDITTSQSAAVEELKRANPDFTRKELYSRAFSIGREHIASLVNTLFLAYAGASLPLFLFFTTINKSQPVWITLNSEFMAEEIVRTMVGSIALILAVPITTFLAAYYFSKYPAGSDAVVHKH